MTRTRTLTWLALPALAILCAAAVPVLAQSQVLVSDQHENKVVRYEWPSGQPIDHFVADGISPLDLATEMTVGPDGNLYVASSASDSVMRYDGRTGQFREAFVPAGSGGLARPRGPTFGPDGNLYVSSENTDRVLRYDGRTGVFIDTFVAARSGGLHRPSGLAFGPDGNLYVAGKVSNTVLRYDGQSGQIIDAVVGDGEAGLSGPEGLLFDDGGTLYIASQLSDSVIIVPSGGAAQILVPPGAGGLVGPLDLALAPDGQTLLVTEVPLGGRVLKFDRNTGAFRGIFVESFAGGISRPVGILFLPDPCPADLNDDGTLDVIDFFQFIVFFAAGCP